MSDCPFKVFFDPTMKNAQLRCSQYCWPSKVCITALSWFIMCFCEINSPFLSDCVFSKGHGKTRPGPAEAGGACEKRKGHLGGEKHFIFILGGEFHIVSFSFLEVSLISFRFVWRWEAFHFFIVLNFISFHFNLGGEFHVWKQTNCKHCSKWTTGKQWKAMEKCWFNKQWETN